MLLPELRALVELHLGEGKVREASEALKKAPRWGNIVTEHCAWEVELGVIAKLVVLADFQESLAGLAGVEAVGGMKELEYFDQNLWMKCEAWLNQMKTA